MPTSFIALSMHLLHVSRGLPLPLEPCGFHWRACHVILFLPFLNVCPTHFNLRLPISVCIGTCPVLSHSCSFLILSVHFSFKIFLKHLLTNTWSLVGAYWSVKSEWCQLAENDKRKKRVLICGSYKKKKKIGNDAGSYKRLTYLVECLFLVS